MKESSAITNVILTLIGDWEQKLASLPQQTIMQRQNSQNRTIKQIIGHLIDSSSNNIHRIVHLQYQPSPFAFPNYATFGNNDRWIAVQDYQNEDWHNMIQLWKYSLLHFCHVIKNVKADKLNNEWISGPDQRTTLKSMIADFPKHLQLHLSEITELLNRDS
ncbi:MAG: DinB family protein [Bacteroidota bacterium]